MPTWADFASAAPAMATSVHKRLEGSRYALLGTVRADGYPRISGVETHFRGPNLLVVTRSDSALAADLRRQPGSALHSGPAHDPTTRGDAKLTVEAVEVTDSGAKARVAASLPTNPPPNRLAVFELRLVDATTIRLDEARTRHVIESWRAGEQGSRVVER